MEIKSEINNFNISKICRTCLTEKEVMKVVFAPDESNGQSIAERIMTFTNIQLKVGDGLPSLICLDCIDQLDKAFSFKQMCEQSDTNLRQFLERPPIIVDIKKEEEEVETTDYVLVDNFVLDDFSHNNGEEDENNKDFSILIDPLGPADIKREEVEERLDVVTDIITQEENVEVTKVIENNKGIVTLKKGQKRLPNKCGICKRRFINSRSFEKHLKMHREGRPVKKQLTGDQPFLCNICGKNLVYRSCLEIHLRTHTGERPFICKVCHKTYMRMAHLNVHMRTHTNERPYECNVCQKGFMSTSNLKVHMRIHTSERSFVCDFCEKTFKRPHDLTRHKKIHITKTN